MTLDEAFAEIGNLAGRWRHDAAARKALWTDDPVAATMAHSAAELQAELSRLTREAARVTTSEYADLRGVRPQTVRRWIKRGYLEAMGGDYPLFPAGQLLGGRKGTPICRPKHHTAKPTGPTALRKWFALASELADVPKIHGRGLYGLRRGATDAAAAALDEEALKRFGGWTDSQMPRQVYKDQRDAEADQRATKVRGFIRGETVSAPVPTEEQPGTDGNA